ncbi:MAG: DNA-binding response regulator [Hydrocarboniphaga sp.]|uniref:sigma-54-dependent transcriptional regulator n=1 Tax=Hydrocarboniphaga sp. TaxID=2033016 RepID=UPI00261F2E2F|nr:sigma-54 dependent transcriptional regulator [Hydrocarboniphaga sp.]MDB5972544.1 DNA-binding response regulator [Hydrocarboniphaga sp.]
MTSALRVLVVDDEANMRRVLEIMLTRHGYRTESAANGQEAFDKLREGGFDLVISDLRMPLINGIELLHQLRDHGIDVPLIMITAQGSIESAVEAMRLGACDYLLRPFDVDALDLAIQRVLNVRGMLQQNQYLREQTDRDWQGLVGGSAAMQRVREQISQVAPTRATVLLTGETGTGKEVVARAIHRASDRHEQLFVALNCAAIPAEMLESELFGHEKGAFTGAVRERVGKFELADKGTIFLDEITEMPLALQTKLLRVLQEGVVEKLGGNRSVSLDLRVIAATNRPPKTAVRENRLREDLYYRLNVFALELPPLRERRDDLPALITHFAQQHLGAGRSVPALSAEALQHLQSYSWPGNVRELGNVIERALILGGGRSLELRHVALDAAEAAPPRAAAEITLGEIGLDACVEGLETRLIREALRQTQGNKTRAAQLLRISERSIWYKLKKYGLAAIDGEP